MTTVVWLVSISFLLMSIDLIITLYDDSGGVIIIRSRS